MVGLPVRTPTTFRPHKLVHGPLQLPIPHPYFPTSHGSFLGLLAALPVAGLHLTGLWAWRLPSHKTKERAEWHSRQWFSEWETYTSEARFWSNTQSVRQMTGRTGQQSLLPEEDGGRRRLPTIGGSDVRLAHQLLGKPVAAAEGKYAGSYWSSPIIKRIGWLCE